MSEPEHTFDESQLPDWAIHDEDDQEELDSFFNAPADRGRAESRFAIPRGDSDIEPSEGAVTNPGTTSTTTASSAPSVPEEQKGTPAAHPASPAASGPASAPGAEAEAAKEPLQGIVAEEDTSRERAQELTPDSTASDEGARNATAATAGEPAAEEPSAGDASSIFAFGKKGSEETPAPRREDFAKFRCIYESKDGKLALYEDAEGHLTAVNTARFV